MMGERYSRWYRVTVQSSGTLAFSVTPTNSTRNVDVALYGPQAGCGTLDTPLRCTGSTTVGATGLQAGATNNSEIATGNTWVAPVNATAGQTYFLLVNATQAGTDYSITWTGTAGLACP